MNSDELHKLEAEILKNIAVVEEGIIKDALTKYLGRVPNDIDMNKCQKRYRTTGDRIDYFRYRLYYDFSFVGTVEHVFPDPFTATELNRTIKINFTPSTT